MMSGSLDDLIEFLLDEIALSGQQGSSVRDIVTFVRQFYGACNGEPTPSSVSHGQVLGSEQPTVDNAFQEQVWTWLTKHPDIRVGKAGKKNKIRPPTAQARSSTCVPTVDHGETPDVSSQSRDYSATLEQSTARSTSPQIESTNAGGGANLYISEQRMWIAICGHLKDPTRISEKEFALLSLIAVHRHGGILQGNLVRLSGQDKRSVPKRTDALRDKCYIEKRVTQVRGLKTSRLILRKFVDKNPPKLHGRMPSTSGAFGISQHDFIDFPSLIQGLFARLSDKQIITRDDLKRELEMTARWQRRILSRVLRKFETIGCLKRVKAASETSKPIQYHFDCIKLLHEPSAKDLEAFHASNTSSIDMHAVNEYEPDDDDDDDDNSHCTATASLGFGTNRGQLQEVGRLLPQWNPDRALPNALQDLIDDAGLRGLTNKEIKFHTFGPFLRRPLENLLARLTSAWFHSQPPFLQHISIIRDIILSGTVPLYVHYSFAKFKARVDSGQALWEAVKPPVADNPAIARNLSAETSTSDANLPLDLFGFPAQYNPSFQCNRALVTLGQALLAARPTDLTLEVRDPILWQGASAALSIRYGRDGEHTKTAGPLGQRKQDGAADGINHGRDRKQEVTWKARDTGNKSLGRPRKFLQGTEKFWQEQFAMARGLASPHGRRTLKSQSGTMKNPAGLSLFAQRPPQFDSTLVRALESGMPVPAEPPEVTQEWIDKTLVVLNRSAAGVYITPKGARPPGTGRARGPSRLIILRNPRLKKPDFGSRPLAFAARFLVSSAAHTFSYLQRPFLGEEDKQLSPYVPPRVWLSPLEPATGSWQKVPSGPGSDRSTAWKRGDTAASQAGSGSVSPTGKSQSGRNRRKTPKGARALRNASEGDNPPSQASKLAVETRSTSRRQLSTGTIDPRRGEKRRERLAYPTNQDPKERLPPCDGDAGKVLGGCSVPVEGLSPARVSHNHGTQADEASVYGATSDRIGAGNRGPMAPEEFVPTIHAQVPCTSEPRASTPQPLSKGRPPAPEATTHGSRKSSASKAGGTQKSPANVEETTLEALRLVQELMTIENAGQGQGNEIQDTEGSIQRVDYKQQSADDRLGLPEMTVRYSDSDEGPPTKRLRPDAGASGSVALLRRKIILDLVEKCGGAMPYYSYSKSLCAAFTTAWRRANQVGKPDNRTIKSIVKSLCQNGSLKQMKFSHRNQKGIMATKTILAKADMSISDHAVLETQKKMIEADPLLYSPHVLEIATKKFRDGEQNSRLPRPAVFDEQTVEPSSTPALVLRHQLRETLCRARERRASAKAKQQDTVRDNHPQETREERGPRLASVKRRYRKNSDIIKRPRLSRTRYTSRPQQSLPSAPLDIESTSSSRTETRQPHLTNESFATQRQPSDVPAAPTRTCDIPGPDSSEQVGAIPPKPRAEQGEAVPVVWKDVGEQSALPLSLEDIVASFRPRKRRGHSEMNVPMCREFGWTVDRIALWEQKSFKLFDSKLDHWGFINVSPGRNFQAARESERSAHDIVFDGLIWFDEGGRQHTEKRLHALRDSSIGHPDEDGKPTKGRERQEMDAHRRKQLLDDQRGGRKRRSDSVAGTGSVKKRRRARPPLTQPQMIRDSAGNVLDVSHLIGAKYRRPRGTQHLRTIPEHLVYKLIISIVVVRALAGGLEKHIDWSLVMCVFPDEDEQFLRDRWKTLSNKHRRDVNELLENFQARFPEAYLKGEVPQMDFDHLEHVDWGGIVRWALRNLDQPIMQEIEDLPSTRSELDQAVNVKIEGSARHYRELFAYNQAVTLPVKEVAISAIPFVVTVPHPPTSAGSQTARSCRKNDKGNDSASALARSWALSTIATPLDSFDAAKAHSKLHSLATTAEESERLVESAMQSLLSSKAVIKKRDKGVDPKGRSYDLSRVFTDTLDQRRSINAAMLKQAVRYKTEVLDPAFRENEPVRFLPVAVEDGDMVAILNLAANGQVLIKPGDDMMPRQNGREAEQQQQQSKNRNFQYQTRKINREALYFTVLIHHVPDTYRFGNALLGPTTTASSPLRIPPEPPSGQGGHIPIWRDIHGGLQRRLWESALAAVLGIIASRPGASVEEMVKMMAPALATVEVEYLMSWGLEAGVVKRCGCDDLGLGHGKQKEKGKATETKEIRLNGDNTTTVTDGWEVREWWWMALALTSDCTATPAEEEEEEEEGALLNRPPITV